MAKLLGLFIVAIAITACGQKAPVKSEAEIKADNAKMIRDNPVYGDQVKAMDKAKAVSDEASKAAAESLKKSDQ